MEYQVTATRRRPQRFEDLLGQEFVAATLQKSIESGKIAHAYLFSGPRGCGKTSSARILAKVLNCAGRAEAAPCGQCTSCTEITAGSCLDVIEIDGASNTGVNDVRQIKDEILFPPNSNRYKIYIIDEVHMLSTSAFNALLKTIEEPPPYVVFIFATTEIHKVPATIKSRCQQFHFKLVPIELVKEALSKAASELGITAEDEALYWIARESTGSVRDAYTLFDQVAAFSDGHITFEKIHEKLGLTGIDSINMLVSLCVEKNGQKALLVLDEILQNGISVEQLICDCSDYFRSLLLIKHGITREALIGQKAQRFPEAVLNGWSSVQIEQALSIVLNLFKDIRFSVDPRYELELAVSRLAWLSDYVSPTDLKNAFEAAKQVIAAGSKGSTPVDRFGAGSNSLSQGFAREYGSASVSEGNAGIARGAEDAPAATFSGADSLTNQFKAILRKEREEKAQKTGFEEPCKKAFSNKFCADKTLSDGIGKEQSLQTAMLKPEPARIAQVQAEQHSPVLAEIREKDGFQPDAKSGKSVLHDGAAKSLRQDTPHEKNGTPAHGKTCSPASFEQTVRGTKLVSLDNLDDVKAEAEAMLLKKNGLLSSAVSQSTGWNLVDGVLHISAKTAFDASLLKKQLTAFKNALQTITGETLNLLVTEYAEPQKPETGTVRITESARIKMITNIFMGKIIDKTPLYEVPSEEDVAEEPSLGYKGEAV